MSLPLYQVTAGSGFPSTGQEKLIYAELPMSAVIFGSITVVVGASNKRKQLHYITE